MDTTTKKIKHGLAGGLAAMPKRPDWTVDQGWDQYTSEQHAVWRTLYERQTRLLSDLACDNFVRGMQRLPMSAEQIPNFEALSETLIKATGWQVVAVPGLLPDDVFFEHLANRRFPSGNFIRRPNELDYLEEPDVFHDVFGHVPMLMHPVMADFIQAYGLGGLRALQLGRLTELARVYWYTVEFGLVKQPNGLRIYGAGIASSYSESVFSVQSDSPNRIGFDLERVMRTHYRIDDFQESYFVLNDLQELLALAETEFFPYYERLNHGPIFEPSDVMLTDRVLHQGTGSYHLDLSPKIDKHKPSRT